MKIDLDLVDCIFLDFDGVLTDNKVTLSSDGKEYVTCSRSDGLAIDILKRLKKEIIIISTEQSSVVKHRANKLKIQCYQKISNKEKELIKIASKNNIKLSKSIFIGNDVNDLKAMKLCKYSICPKDSHQSVKKFCDLVLKSKGGESIMREVIENVLSINTENYF